MGRNKLQAASLNRIHVNIALTNDMPSQKMPVYGLFLMFFHCLGVRIRTVYLSDSVQDLEL